MSAPVITSKKCIADWNAFDLSKATPEEAKAFRLKHGPCNIIAKSIGSDGRMSGAVAVCRDGTTLKIYRRADFSLI